MYLLFVDESGTPPKPGFNELSYFVMAGLVIPEDRWMGMHDRLSGLKRASNFHGEVKWRYFAPQNDDAENPMAEWSKDRRNEFRDRVFSIITDTRSCKDHRMHQRMPNRLRAWKCELPRRLVFPDIQACH